MTFRQRLLKAQPLTASLGVYIPAVIVQRLVGLGRTILFTWMMSTDQFGLWGLACMVFLLGATVVTLGSFNGITRYVSRYQQRGWLRGFRRAVAWKLTAMAAGITLVGLALSGWLAGPVTGTVAAGSAVDAGERLAVFSAAVVNALLVGMYLNMIAWMRGLRVYRLVSCVDVLYGLLFLALALPALAVRPSALSALIAHAAALAAVLAAGRLMLRRAVEAAEEAGSERPGSGGAHEPGDPSALAARDPGRALRRLLAFSVVAMAAGLIWQGQGYVSLWFVQRYHHERGAGLYTAYMVLCQAIPVLATTTWVVVFSHVLVHWERGERDLARRKLEVAYKASVAVLSTLAVLIYLCVDLWVLVLPADFRQARQLLPWLLMHLLATANVGYAYVASNLRERPSVSALTGAAAVAANVLLAMLLVPDGGPLGGAQAAGLAGGVCLLVAGGYLVISRFGASPAALVMSLTPALMLLPARWAGSALAAGWLVLLATPLVLTPAEKALLARSVRAVLHRLGSPGGRA